MKPIFTLLLCWLALQTSAQSFQFAFVTDLHVGGATGADDLRRTVKDINANPNLKFVLLTGDLTEFGSDEELQLAKTIIDSLQKPWYAIPGNHDANWSESGSNTFKRVFKGESFSFEYGGFAFIATASGPNMRMGPGQVPREHLVWLDSTLNHLPNPKIPIVYINHYPQDASLNNWYDALDRVKKRNVQLFLCGHGHQNKVYDFEHIPGVMGRSNLRAKAEIGGYNIVTLTKNEAVFTEKTPGTGQLRSWATIPLYDHEFSKDTTHFPRPSYAVNEQYAQVKTLWQYQDNSDIGSGITVQNDLILCSNTNGLLYALDEKGQKKWSFPTAGKVYATPAANKKYAVIASSDRWIYAVNRKNGSLRWKYETGKAAVGSPVIHENRVYVGGSDGHFRAFDLKTGKVLWDFDGVKGFIVTKPLIYQSKIYFGCWANDFYALDLKTGKLVWKWNNGSPNRMYSPAACYPVGTNNRIFIVAPDRYMTALDAATGEVIWRKQNLDVRVRESMGLSGDGSLVYVKTMQGNIYGVSTTAAAMELPWKAQVQLDYEICPTAIVEKDGVVYVPGNSGLLTAIDRQTGQTRWQHKLSNALVSGITPLGRGKVLVSTMDGKVTCLQGN
ncbi:metallophosphoesterase [Siphonobacter sp. BAB-5385]|uniref:outer membrane protein assembly factor BamB family protein n=1 Tax=Siphonobacter sp. BAB-5385 TaxID=1864822 RepID=UPI000B9E0E54|nr:PQQ-binding-like beta-propeller repeat protein [Siphonobacter sp. BAB-5385]OZI09075.1 metallophosphoesterase [Siphonobacter sp. BAB-5385]